VREADGLAMSSRNRYLTPEGRKTAPLLHRTIVDAAAKVRAGGAVDAAEKAAVATLETAGFKVDYVAVRDAETLARWEPESNRPCRVLAAAWLGKTRLIDNV